MTMLKTGKLNRMIGLGNPALFRCLSAKEHACLQIAFFGRQKNYSCTWACHITTHRQNSGKVLNILMRGYFLIQNRPKLWNSPTKTTFFFAMSIVLTHWPWLRTRLKHTMFAHAKSNPEFCRWVDNICVFCFATFFIEFF